LSLYAVLDLTDLEIEPLIRKQVTNYQSGFRENGQKLKDSVAMQFAIHILKNLKARKIYIF